MHASMALFTFRSGMPSAHWGVPACVQATLREHAQAAQEVLSQGVYDVLMKQGPLQLAARMGNVDALQLLLDAGAAASLDAEDGNGLTALQARGDHQPFHACNMRGMLWLKGGVMLQASRLHPEQCEAEGVLLRAGAVDVSADDGVPVEEGELHGSMATRAADPSSALATYLADFCHTKGPY